MTEIINKYETIFILDASLEEEKLKELVLKFKSLIESEGTIESIDEWGKRRLAYTIDYKTEGYYVLIKFDAKPTFIKELDRVYGITEGIIRSLVIKKDE